MKTSIYPTKSILQPSQEKVTIRFPINSVKLTRDKEADIKNVCKNLLKNLNYQRSIREYSQRYWNNNSKLSRENARPTILHVKGTGEE